MSKITERQKKFIFGIGIVNGGIGVLLMVLILMGGIEGMPIFIPSLMLVASTGLFIAGGKQSSK
ncbi:hypothetical protein SH449x_002179 [Pirellulaceae bacterium SH449]